MDSQVATRRTAGALDGNIPYDEAYRRINKCLFVPCSILLVSIDRVDLGFLDTISNIGHKLAKEP